MHINHVTRNRLKEFHLVEKMHQNFYKKSFHLTKERHTANLWKQIKKVGYSKPSKDTLSKDECKALKELQSDASIVILPAGKGKCTVILNREDYLEKCIDHVNNGSYQLLKNDPTTKIKAKKLEKLKVPKESEFIDNNLFYYLKPTDQPAPRFHGQQKIHKPGVSIRPIV